MTTESGATAEESKSLLAEPSTISGGHRRHLAGRVALATGAVALLIGAAGFSKYKFPQSTLADLTIPFKLYDWTNDKELPPMPDRADKYNGIEDKRHIDVVADEDGNTHVFAIGDWGGELPNHHSCFAKMGWDQFMQQTIADKMKKRAAGYKPQYVLNVGDNFYVAGLLVANCQQPPDAIRGAGEEAFTSGWQWIYGELANIPWLTAFGNHDYGGYIFGNAWPQQIGYSFINYNWIMPSRWFNKKVQHPGYEVEYFVYDSNAFDAKHTGEDDEHNICSGHNYGGPVQSCANNGGMSSVGGCYQWFWDTHKQQLAWLDQKLGESTADWKIVVTHFPCGYNQHFWKRMKAKHGVDLLVTGHRHQQELWRQDTPSKYIQHFMEENDWDGSAPACFVTGGGGGITSENFGYADYGTDLQLYGFYHLTMNKRWINIESISSRGDVEGNWTIYARGSPEEKQQRNMTYKGGPFPSR